MLAISFMFLCSVVQDCGVPQSSLLIPNLFSLQLLPSIHLHLSSMAIVPIWGGVRDGASLSSLCVREVGYTLNRSPANHWEHIDKHSSQFTQKNILWVLTILGPNIEHTRRTAFEGLTCIWWSLKMEPQNWGKISSNVHQKGVQCCLRHLRFFFFFRAACLKICSSIVLTISNYLDI